MSERNSDKQPVHDDDPDERIRYWVDWYAEKVRGGPGNEQPENWTGVWRVVEGHLREIAVAPTGILRDALAGTRSAIQGVARFIKGTAEWPLAIARRIARGQARVDSEEDRRQTRAGDEGPLLSNEHEEPARPLIPDSGSTPALPAPPSGTAALPAPAQAANDLESALQAIRSSGRQAQIYRLPDGRFVIVLGPTGTEAKALFAASEGVTKAQDFPPGFADRYVPAPTDDPDAFAMVVDGDSMEPEYRRGELVIFSPLEVQRHGPQSGKDYAVQLDGQAANESSFRRLFTDEDDPSVFYLRCINPKYKTNEKVRRERVVRLARAIWVSRPPPKLDR